MKRTLSSSTSHHHNQVSSYETPYNAISSDSGPSPSKKRVVGNNASSSMSHQEQPNDWSSSSATPRNAVSSSPSSTTVVSYPARTNTATQTTSATFTAPRADTGNDTGTRKLMERTIYFDIYQDQRKMYKIAKDVQDCVEEPLNWTEIANVHSSRARDVYKLTNGCVNKRIEESESLIARIKDLAKKERLRKYLAPFQKVAYEPELCAKWIREMVLMGDNVEKLKKSNTCVQYEYLWDIDGTRYYPLHKLQIKQNGDSGIADGVIDAIINHVTDFYDILIDCRLTLLVLNEACLWVNKDGMIKYHRHEYIYDGGEGPDSYYVMEDQVTTLKMYLNACHSQGYTKWQVSGADPKMDMNWDPERCLQSLASSRVCGTQVERGTVFPGSPLTALDLPILMQDMVPVSSGLSGNAYRSADSKYIIKTTPLTDDMNRRSFVNDRRKEYEQETRNIEFLSKLTPYPKNIPKYHLYSRVTCKGDVLYLYDNPYHKMFRTLTDWQNLSCCGTIVMSNFAQSQTIVTYLKEIDDNNLHADAKRQIKESCLLDLFAVALELFEAINEIKWNSPPKKSYIYHSDLHFSNILVRKSNGQTQPAQIPTNKTYFTVKSGSSPTYTKQPLEYCIIDFGRFGTADTPQKAFANMVHRMSTEYFYTCKMDVRLTVNN